MKFLLGTKQNMTQIFDENGNVIPVTSVLAGPTTVTQIKTIETDGYNAVQIGFGEKKTKNIKKPQRKMGNFRYIKEFRLPKDTKPECAVGDVFSADELFNEGDVVTVSGISKGKGFQGVVKRHGFHGGPRSHGQKHSEREPGSIGATGPQRVFKGTRMAGRMGSDRITVKNLKIIKIDKDNSQLFVSGAIPGRKGTLLEIKG